MRTLDRWATRSLAAFFAAGALLVVVVTVLGERERPELALASAALAALGGVVLATRRVEANVALRHGALLTGTVLIGLLIVSSGSAELADEVLFVWVGLYGGFFVGHRALAAHLLAVLLVCVGALVLGADGMSVGVVAARSVDVVGATVAAAVWSAVVRALVDRSIAVEVRRADTDALSGLPNRRQLERVGVALEAEATPFAVVVIDLDDFKKINDRNGHAVGDALLQAVAERLRGAVAAGDTVARLGGDEFVVVLRGVDSVAGAQIARRIVDHLARPFTFEGLRLDVMASAGVAASSGGSFRRTLDRADRVMYRAKREGGGWASDDGAAGSRSLVPLGSAALPEVEGDEGGTIPSPDHLELDELEVILDARAVHSAYQPLVELSSGRVVGFEALARGPEGARLAAPLDLFAAARHADRSLELEWLCRLRALEGAEAHLPAEAAVFVNAEPSSFSAEPPGELVKLTERVARARTVVVELTERALVDEPAAVLRAVAQLRAMGCAIALDDVGADPRSVALIPYVRPDVIKLDLRLVQQQPSPALVATIHAVGAAAERTGALLLAEGIETQEQEEIARSIGATHGQGWHFGRPSRGTDQELSASRPGTGNLPVNRASIDTVDPDATPFSVVSEACETRVATKQLLYSISKYLEHHLAANAEASVLLSTFQRHQHFTPATQERYAELAETTAFTAVFAEGMPERPAPGLRGIELSADEPLRAEWDVVVVTPHLAAAFVARDLGDGGVDDEDRRFEFALTYDRDLAVIASSTLMSRVADAPLDVPARAAASPAA